RKRKQSRFPEYRRAKRKQAEPKGLPVRVVGHHFGATNKFSRRTGLERAAIEGKSPVVEGKYPPEWILSTTEDVKFRRNPVPPSPKAKYSLVTDSEPVP